MKKIVLGMAAGAALAWFLDPDNGPRRRDSVTRTLQQKGLMSAPPVPTTTTADDPMASAVAAIR